MWEFVFVFAISYVWHALGITIGYHRLLSHRSFACPKLFEYFWVLAGYLAFEGSPIWWITMHRAHHRHEDTALDPHSPRYGLKNAHYGWMMQGSYPAHIDPAKQSKDLINDPIYRFLEQGGDLQKGHRLVFMTAIAFRLVILVFFGWIPALASLLAGVAVLQIPLMLNVICHLPKFGYKNYQSPDDSVNVWWVGLLAMGEGWHNNHHAAPGSAKTGMRPWEFDLSWLIISAMNKLGVVSRVNVASEAQLVRNAMLKSTKEAGVDKEVQTKEVQLAETPIQNVPMSEALIQNVQNESDTCDSEKPQADDVAVHKPKRKVQIVRQSRHKLVTIKTQALDNCKQA